MDYNARLVAATVRKTLGRSAQIVRWSAAMCEMERSDQLTVAGSDGLHALVRREHTPLVITQRVLETA